MSKIGKKPMIEKFHIPMKILSEANLSEHFRVKAARKKKQKKIIKLFLVNSKIQPPCKVILTRIAPRDLDSDDNLPAAMKHPKDIVADHLIPGLAPGRADGSNLIKWEFAQKKGNPKYYALEIHIESQDY